MDYRTWPDFGMKYELTESMNRGRYEMMAPHCKVNHLVRAHEFAFCFAFILNCCGKTKQNCKLKFIIFSEMLQNLNEIAQRRDKRG